MKYVKGERRRDRERETGWGTCVSAGENCGKEEQTDRWAERGRRKEEWILEREKETKIGQGETNKWMGWRTVRKTDKFGRCVCGGERDGLSAGERCVSARYLQ